MSASIQTAVSDGTMTFIDVSLEFFDQSEISVLFDDIGTDDWEWSNSFDNRIVFLAPSTPVPNGVEVKVKRTTDLTKLRHEFSTGAAFTAQALDEDLKQVLHIAQEAYETAPTGEFYQDINMHGFRVRNMADGVDAMDAVTLGQYQADADGAAASAAAAAASAAAAAASAATLAGIGGAGGAAMVGYKLPVTGSSTRTVQDRLDDTRWIEDMALPGDLTIHEAFGRAVALGAGVWHIGAGPYAMNPAGAVLIPDGFKLICHGTTITHNTTTVPTFWAQEVDNWAILGELTIVGAGNAPGTAVGVQRVAGGRFTVENVTCRNISGRGFYEVNGAIDAGTRGDQGNWINCKAYDCDVGREDIADSSTEYNLWVNFTASGCRLGNVTAAGNNMFIGGNIVDNTVGGVWVKNGGNHAHGAFVGVNINHNGPGLNGWNIRLTDVENGQTFTGCHVYGDAPTTGVLWIERSKGVLYTGGILDASIFCDAPTGYSMVCDNFVPDSANQQGKYGPTGTTDPGVRQVVVARNMARTGSWRFNDPAGPLFMRASRSGGQSITSATPTTLVFNAESYDTRGAHDTTTGVFTAPWLGNYRVTGAVRISAASGIPAGGGFVTVRVNGVAQFFSPVVANSAVLGIGNFSFIVGVAAGATIDVQVTITGTTLVFDLGQLTVEEIT